MDNIIININSTFRDKTKYPNSTDFSYDLPSQFNNIIYMRLTSIEVPNIHYVFKTSKNNNTFKILYNFQTFTITLTEGNYTSDTFINELTSKLDDVNTSAGTLLAVTISTVTGKITITNNAEITLDFSRTGDTTYNGIGCLMGYSNTTYTGTSFEADSVINLIGNHYFYIKINDIDNVVDEYVGNAFAKIIANTDKFNVQFEDYDSFISKDKLFRSPINFNKIKVQLVDYRGTILEFGEHEFSFTLELGYVYDFNLYKNISNNGIPNGDDRIKFLYK